jgi:hypothetical protein
VDDKAAPSRDAQEIAMSEPVSPRTSATGGERPSPLDATSPKSTTNDSVDVLVGIAVALAVSFALFGDSPIAFLGYGVLAFAGLVVLLIFLAIVGQLLMDLADPIWRAEFCEDLVDLKARASSWLRR